MRRKDHAPLRAGRPLRRMLLTSALGCALLASASCEETTTPGGDGGGGGGGDSGSLPSNLLKLKKAGENAQLSFSEGTEQYLIVAYSVSTTQSDAIDFSIKLTSKASSGGSGDGAASASDGGTGSQGSSLRVPRLPMMLRQPALWVKWQKRLAIEAWTRSLRERAARLQQIPQMGQVGQQIAACTSSADCGKTEVCNAGSCQSTVTLKTDAFSSGSIQAAVKRKGDVAAILVDSTATVSAADLDKMLKDFEDTIYKRDVALFGNPPLKSGEKTLTSDRNKDGLLWIVLTSKVEDKNSAVGFFVATDFLDTAKSNKADILWMVPPSGSTKVVDVERTMAHELQHLLGYANKVYKAKVGGKTVQLLDLWLDEGLAHFAEDAAGYGGENVTLLDQELFTGFADTSMVTGDDSLAMRAAAFLFVRYLFEQQGGVSYSGATISDKGGAKWLQKLYSSAKTGSDLITESAGRSFASVYDDFIVTIGLDKRGVTSNKRYNYGALVDDSVTGNKIGVAVRGSRKDNTGETVKLKGPIEEALTADTSGTVANTAGKFYLLKGKTGTVEVEVTSQESDVRYAVIKLK